MLIEWEGEFDAYWVRAWDDQSQYHNSGRLGVNHYTLHLPADDSRIDIRVYGLVGRVWRRIGDTRFTNSAREPGSPISITKTIDQRCVISDNADIDFIPFMFKVGTFTDEVRISCSVSCPMGSLAVLSSVYGETSIHPFAPGSELDAAGNIGFLVTNPNPHTVVVTELDGVDSIQFFASREPAAPDWVPSYTIDMRVRCLN